MSDHIFRSDAGDIHVNDDDNAPRFARWFASLGEFDLDVPHARGATPREAAEDLADLIDAVLLDAPEGR